MVTARMHIYAQYRSQRQSDRPSVHGADPGTICLLLSVPGLYVRFWWRRYDRMAAYALQQGERRERSWLLFPSPACRSERGLGPASVDPPSVRISDKC